MKIGKGTAYAGGNILRQHVITEKRVGEPVDKTVNNVVTVQLEFYHVITATG